MARAVREFVRVYLLFLAQLTLGSAAAVAPQARRPQDAVRSKQAVSSSGEFGGIFVICVIQPLGSGHRSSYAMQEECVGVLEFCTACSAW
jgi:hypothetical protein